MSRRNDVAGFRAGQAQHAGLWLDKYFEGTQQDTAQAVKKAQLVSEVAGIAEPEAYKDFFDRWKTALAQAGVAEKHMRQAEVVARMAVGLGGEAVLETAITLHRTYGVPYIPGSALKGVAASYARNKLDDSAWRKQSGRAYEIMFGNTTAAGYVTFFDALYVPGSGYENEQRKPQALWPDVITVHHPDYYSGKDSAPADWDNPNPVPFLTATGKYLIALQGDDAWVERAFEILALALAEEGVGAKTSSGYGRMRVAGMEIASVQPTNPDLPSSQPKARPQLETVTRKGTVTRLFSSKRGGVTGGIVQDAVTGQECQFSTDILEGNQPGKGTSVIFKTQGDAVVYLKRI